MSRPARRLTRAAVVVGVAVLSGCGGDDPVRPAEEEAAVREVLEEALDALYEGDGRRACSLYTSSYRRELVAENQADKSEVAPKGSSCEAQVRDFSADLRRFVPGRKVRVLEVTVSGDDATAISEFDGTRGKTRVKEFLVLRAGRWKIDHDQEAGEAP